MSKIARRALRLVVTVPLGLLYGVGMFAALVVLTGAAIGVTCGSAVRLGWTETRKRAEHGAA